DPRIHWATPTDHRRMWGRSAECYDLGIPAGEWTIPASEGRPSSIAADDTENDSTNSGIVGCMGVDHIHHLDNGGWLLADVWYEGIHPYLVDGVAPSEASGTGVGQFPMVVTGFNKIS